MVERIFLDLDGVLANWINSVFRLFGKEYDEATYPNNWNVWEEIGLDSEEEMWARIDGSTNFWENIKPYYWKEWLLWRCKSSAPTTILSKPHKRASCYFGKADWCRRHCGIGDPWLVQEKWPIARKNWLLIDDNNENCQKWADNGGHAIIFPEPWNGRRGMIDKRQYYVGFMIAHYETLK